MTQAIEDKGNGMLNGTKHEQLPMASYDRHGSKTRQGQEKTDRYKWAKAGAAGELAWVSPNDINVDDEYQRQLNEKKVLDIAREFSWPAFGVVTLARRDDGTLWAFDSMHRVFVARRRNIALIPAIIFAMDDRAEEAKAFLDTNTHRRPLTGLDKHRARVMVGDEAAVLVDKLLADGGRQASELTAKGKVRCVATMTNYAAKAPDLLKRIWPLVLSLTEGAPVHERVLSSLMWIEAHADAGNTILDKRWKERLMAMGVEGILAAANRAAVFYSKGGEGVWARGVLEDMNKGRREENKFRLRTADAGPTKDPTR